MPASPAPIEEIDLAGAPVALRRRVSPSMIVQAVRIWAKFGTPLEIAKYLGNVPPHAVEEFTRQTWWTDIAKQLRSTLDLDIEQSFGRLGARALAQLEDRLTYGDFYINRLGQRARRPLTAKELTDIAKLAFEKRKEARALVEGITGEGEKEPEKTDLEKLAELLRSAALRTTPQNPIIDVTPTAQPSTPAQTAANPTPQPSASNVIPFNSGHST